jgi:uncharacterized protein (TIGR03067 family)
MFRGAFLALLATCLVASAQAEKDKKADTKDDAKAQLEKLAGTWKLEKEVRDGEEKKAEDIQLVFMEEKVTLKEEGKATAGTVKIDAAKKPAQIDITADGSDRPIQAIFELDGDSLKLAFTLDGGARPEKFESKSGSKVTLATFKRVKS